MISAFIKSIRGSDPDAAVFWLARMIEAGEDPRYIARRMIVHASEDIGLADPRALLVADAAAHAVEYVGLPEARLNLAQAAIYLARAPKSNSVYLAINAATEDAASADPVPLHLRDASSPTGRKLGHGKGYRYPHDYPGHRVDQEYRPQRFEGKRYYEPSGEGEDAARRSLGRLRPRRLGIIASPTSTGDGPSPRDRHHGAGGTDMVAALDGGDIALIVLSAFWGLLVLFLCIVLLNTFRVLE